MRPRGLFRSYGAVVMVPGLAPHLADVLLRGECRDRTECARAGIALDGTYDHWGWLDDDPRYCMAPEAAARLRERLRGLWAQHAPALLAEWQRRGGSGPCWASRVFDEEGA